MRYALMFFFCFPVVGSLAITDAAGDTRFRHGPLTVESGAGCLTQREISAAVRVFSTGGEAQVDKARTLLLNGSRQSPRCRERIVTTLMEVLDKPYLNFEEDQASFYLWRHGADLLGDLKAVEALDLLISHLDLSSGAFSSSMNHRPALRGIIKMGSLAVPKLDDLLRNSPDPKLRHLAVYCIATIGGPSAVSSLKQASDLESDKCVSRFIRISLDSFDDNGRIKNRLAWFSGFLCNEQS